MRIFFYAGIAFLAVGSIFVFTSVDSVGIASGWGFVVGCILLLIGAVFTIIASPVNPKNRERTQENQTPKLSASRKQLAVAVVVGAVFLLGFFLVYPGGILRNYIDFNTSPEYESQLFEGLERQYKVGDTLAFSLRTDGCRWDTEELPQTTIRRIMDADGKVDNKIIWVGTVTLRTPPECADEGYKSLRTTYFEGTFKPLVLEEAGLYEITVEVFDPQVGARQFRVVER